MTAVSLALKCAPLLRMGGGAGGGGVTDLSALQTNSPCPSPPIGGEGTRRRALRTQNCALRPRQTKRSTGVREALV
jgi:hypothetical protein